jgi:hypothetical protein
MVGLWQNLIIYLIFAYAIYNHSEGMNLTVVNLPNDLSKNNAVYISTKLAKDPSSTVVVRISHRIFKCCFWGELEKTKIAMSKNVRTFLNTDIGKQVTV